jgi:flavoprotein
MCKLKTELRHRILHDKAASAAPVSEFCRGVYHTMVVAPARSSTVAKSVMDMSDTLAANVFAQAGKCRLPATVCACDTASELQTMAPHGPVQVYPRKIDLESTARLTRVERTNVAEALAELDGPWLSA